MRTNQSATAAPTVTSASTATPGAVSLTRDEQAMIHRTAAAEGIPPASVLRRIMAQEAARIQKEKVSDHQIYAFADALRRCGIEPDDFDDDVALWKGSPGPVVLFKKPRAAGYNGRAYGYRLGHVRKALRQWEQDKLAAEAV